MTAAEPSDAARQNRGLYPAGGESTHGTQPVRKPLWNAPKVLLEEDKAQLRTVDGKSSDGEVTMPWFLRQGSHLKVKASH